jgi:hypothetical protein
MTGFHQVLEVLVGTEQRNLTLYGKFSGRELLRTSRYDHPPIDIRTFKFLS